MYGKLILKYLYTVIVQSPPIFGIKILSICFITMYNVTRHTIFNQNTLLPVASHLVLAATNKVDNLLAFHICS